MPTFSKNLVLGLFLLLNACGASTVTASTRGGGAGGPSGGLERVFAPDLPPNRDQPMFDRQADHEESPVRENPSFRYERDCWRCR